MKLLIKKQISVLIFNEGDYSTRQFAVSQGVFMLAVAAVCALLCLTGWAVVRSDTLHETVTAAALLEETSRSQGVRVAAQSRQISLLNEKVNSLTEKFDQLQNQKKEICRIGRIEQSADNENLFGVGGSRVDGMTGAAHNEKSGGKERPGATGPGPDTHRSDSAAVDPETITGCTFVLAPSDLRLSPITCMPVPLPVNDGPMAGVPASSRQEGKGHPRGMVLKTGQGDEIVTPANGIITFIDVNDNSGGTVIIDHGHGYVTRYARLAGVTRELGALVMKGEVIGNAKSGPSEAPSQFYYELLVNGLPVHPEKYIARSPFLL